VKSCPNIKVLSPVQLKPFPEQYKLTLEKDSLLECSHEELYQYNYITLHNIITSPVAQTCFGKLYPWCNKVALPIFPFNTSVELELKQEDLALMLGLRSLLKEFIAPFLPLWLFIFFPSPHSLRPCLSLYFSGHDYLLLFYPFHFFFLTAFPVSGFSYPASDPLNYGGCVQTDIVFFLPSSPSIQNGQLVPSSPSFQVVWWLLL